MFGGSASTRLALLLGVLCCSRLIVSSVHDLDHGRTVCPDRTAPPVAAATGGGVTEFLAVIALYCGMIALVASAHVRRLRASRVASLGAWRQAR